MKIQPSPYTVVCDTRENLPYTFANPFTSGRSLYTIQTVTGTLASGDYSLRGYESAVAVERKSLKDLFGTIGQGRGRFQRELERLSKFTFAVVMIEAEWSEILTNPPKRSRLNPVNIAHSIIAWEQRYPTVHWRTVPGREMGEIFTLRILDRFWRDSKRLLEDEQNKGVVLVPSVPSVPVSHSTSTMTPLLASR